MANSLNDEKSRLMYPGPRTTFLPALPGSSPFETNAPVLKYCCSVRLPLGRIGFPTRFGREFVGDLGFVSSTTLTGVPERITRMLLICQPPSSSSIGRLHELKN